MAEELDGTAAFNEVIEVGLSTDEFNRGLDSMMDRYEQFIKELESKGADPNAVLGIGGTQNIEGAISSLVEQIGSLKSSIDDIFGSTNEATTGAVESIQKEVDAITASARATETAETAKQAALKKTADERQLLLEEQAKDSSGGFLADIGKGFSGKSNTSFGEMIGNVARFQVLWTGVGLAMNAMAAPFKMLIDGIKEGVEYSIQLEQKAYELTGVLADNVKFSSNLKDNFRIASEAAPAVVKALQDVSASTGLKFDNLFRSFSALSVNGAAGTVRNLNEMVQLAELFNLSLRASGASVETSRKLISEIPNALAGTLPPSSALLHVIHMSNDEWQKMLAAGLKHQDLLQRLSEHMQPYLDATKDAQENTEELKNKVDLIEKRWEALAAAPALSAYKTYLQGIIDLAAKHEKQIESFFSSKTTATPLSGTKSLSISNAPGVSLGAEAAIYLGVPPDELSKDDLKLPTPSKEDLAKNLLALPISAKHQPAAGKPNNDALTALHESYSKELKGIKDAAQVDLASIEESERAHTISVKEATDARIIIYQEEKRQIDELVAATRKKFRTVGGTKTARTGFSTTLGTEEADAAAADNKDEARARGQNDQDQLAISKSALEAQMGLATKKADWEISEAKRSGATQLAIVDEIIAAQKKEFADKQSILDIEAEEAGENELALQVVANKRALLTQQERESAVTGSRQRAEALQRDIVASLGVGVRRARDTTERTQEIFARNQARGQTSYDSNQEEMGVISTQLAQNQAEQIQAHAKLRGGNVSEDSKEYQDNVAAVAKLTAEEEALTDKLQQLKDSSSLLGNASQKLFGSLDPFTKDGKADIGKTFSSIGHAAGQLKDGFNSVYSSFKNGGALAGIGTSLSTVGQFVPGPVGAGLQAAGAVVGLISSIFTAAAQKIGEQVSKAVSDVMLQYEQKNITLSQAIIQIEDQRNSAIAQLAGKKGGSKVLEQLLPQLDQQIASLKDQQQQIKTTFEQNVLITAQNNDATKQWLTDWININQQVKQYLDAVGHTSDALQQATQYLNQMLAAQRLTQETTLNNDQQQAIQDAINLNNLLLQRNQMELDYQHSVQQLNLQYQQTYQATVGGNSLERRGDPTLDSAKKLSQVKSDFEYQLQQMTTQHDLQMQQTNAEINQLTQKVDLERQLFGIATDTNTLQQEALQASLFTLQQYASQVTSIQQLLSQTAGLTASNGQFPGNPFFPNVFPQGGLGPIPGSGALNLPASTSPGGTSGTFVINVGGINVDGAGKDGTQIATDIADQLDYQMRTRGVYAIA